MELQNCIDVVEKLLRQNKRNYKDSHEQLLYERGYLTGLLARMMSDDPSILHQIINKTNHHWLVETVRFELTVHITTYDRLATCCLRPLGHVSWYLVPPPGLEPGTNGLWVRCANQLRYRGMFGAGTRTRTGMHKAIDFKSIGSNQFPHARIYKQSVLYIK